MSALAGTRLKFAALGMRFQDRARRFEEQIELMRRLRDRTRSPSRRGRHGRNGWYQLGPIQQPIPVWIGASAEAAVKRATKIADGFLPLRPTRGRGGRRPWTKCTGGSRKPRAPEIAIDRPPDTARRTPDDWRNVDMWRGFGASASFSSRHQRRRRRAASPHRSIAPGKRASR